MSYSNDKNSVIVLLNEDKAPTNNHCHEGVVHEYSHSLGRWFYDIVVVRVVLVLLFTLPLILNYKYLYRHPLSILSSRTNDKKANIQEAIRDLDI